METDEQPRAWLESNQLRVIVPEGLQTSEHGAGYALRRVPMELRRGLSSFRLVAEERSERGRIWVFCVTRNEVSQ